MLNECIYLVYKKVFRYIIVEYMSQDWKGWWPSGMWLSGVWPSGMWPSGVWLSTWPLAPSWTEMSDMSEHDPNVCLELFGDI